MLLLSAFMLLTQILVIGDQYWSEFDDNGIFLESGERDLSNGDIGIRV